MRGNGAPRGVNANSLATRTRLILVRHGETVGNSSVRYYGRTDLELSDLGRRQMHAVARWLATQFGATQFAPVFSSTMRRASEGACIIAGADATIIRIAEFVEVDFGLFEGLTAEEIGERYPAEFVRWNRDRLAAGYAYPNGESRSEFAKRVGQGVDRMLSLLDHAPEALPENDLTALLVAHRGVIRAVLQRLARVEPQIDLGSVNVISRSDRRHGWQIEALDVTEHLAGLEPYRE